MKVYKTESLGTHRKAKVRLSTAEGPSKGHRSKNSLYYDGAKLLLLPPGHESDPHF